MTHPILELRTLSDELYQVSGLRLERFSEQRLWLFDLEATDLDTSRERVTQIAGIPLENGQLVEERAFTQYVALDPEVEIPEEVQKLTGITRETLEGAPPFPQAWQLALDAARGSDLWIGQSVFEFDVPLLEAEFSRHHMPVQLPPILDSVVLATALLGPPEERWSTSKLLTTFRVDVGDLRRHDALDDVKILGLILQPLLERLRRERDDVLDLVQPLQIRRHPPVRSELGNASDDDL